MTAIIIQSVSGLTSSVGLTAGPGLLISPTGFSGYGILFAGNGRLAASVGSQGVGAFVTLPGLGGVSALPSGRYVTNPARFVGAGSVSALVKLALRASISLSGAGSVSGTSPSSYHASAVHFDGNANVTTNSLTSTDNAFLSFSIWLNTITSNPSNNAPVPWVMDPQGVDGSELILTNAVSGQGSVNTIFQTDNQDNAYMQASYTQNGVLSDVWHNIIYSGDSNLGIYALYIDGVLITPDGGGHISPSFTTGFNGLPLWFADDAVKKCVGDFADFWFAPGQSLLSGSTIPSATLAKFITGGGKPVNLGADGSTPTGTAPRVFFSGDYTAFPVNRGTGGSFTLTGTLTDASTSPSD